MSKQNPRMSSLTLLFIFLCFYSVFLARASSSSNPTCIEKIFQFGDSNADNGNLVALSAYLAPSARWPYGETDPGCVQHPPFYQVPFGPCQTGRFSDGRLIIDFIAKFFGLPYLNPNLKWFNNFSNGVNYAVTASTALDALTLAKYNVFSPQTLILPSLEQQFATFETDLKNMCNSFPDCRGVLGRSVLFCGEIGQNDVGNALQYGVGIRQIQNYLPTIIALIVQVVKKSISYGANNIFVPNLYPVGCWPYVQTMVQNYKATYPQDLDSYGCNLAINNLIDDYNRNLQANITDLANQYPNVTLEVLDYNGAFLVIFRNPTEYGFDDSAKFLPCCYGNSTDPLDPRFCGGIKFLNKPCPNPRLHINWDSIHLTHYAAYYIAEQLKPNLTRLCNS